MPRIPTLRYPCPKRRCSQAGQVPGRSRLVLGSVLSLAAPQLGQAECQAARSAPVSASLRGAISAPRQPQAGQCWRSGEGATAMRPV